MPVGVSISNGKDYSIGLTNRKQSIGSDYCEDRTKLLCNVSSMYWVELRQVVDCRVKHKASIVLGDGVQGFEDGVKDEGIDDRVLRRVQSLNQD